MNLFITIPETWQTKSFNDWILDINMKAKNSRFNQDIKQIPVDYELFHY